jgi:hypothetical protein
VVLVDFLCANTNIFAWSPSDMSGILREVGEHSLDNGCGTSTKSGAVRSEWRCGSSSMPDSSRKSFTLRG